jgi:transcription elongation factor SPT4
MSIETIPSSIRNLRACLLCSLVKQVDQFEADGCENCEHVLGLKHNRDNVYNCTSSNFDGLVALMDPSESWVGKWLRINRNHPGMYAISVSGRLPPDVVREIKGHGEVYKSRDRSSNQN